MRWIQYSEDFPRKFKRLAGVNLRDKHQCQQELFPSLRHSKGLIDYYLEHLVFHDRNLDTSQPSGTRDPAPPLLRRLRPGSTSAQVCSGLLRSAHPSHQKSSTFNEEPEKAPFPSQGVPNLFPLYAHSQTVILSACLHARVLFLPSGCFTPSSAFCLGLRSL